MEATEKLLDKAVSEIETMLNTKTVVGEPMVVGDHTLIPLVSVGFGFGGGGGKCDDEKSGDCQGSGTGGGGGVKPVALIIVNAEGVRVEPIKSASASAFEKIAEIAGNVATSKKAESTDSKADKKPPKNRS